jgi:predicted Zn-dependent peptidase
LAGASHFIEHLLFKGTKRRTARQISQAIEGRGGYLNAFTQEESTCYYARVPFDHAWRAADVLSDMYQHASFDAREVEKERGVIIEEIMMYRDQPHHEVHDILSELLWTGHALGRPIAGYPETVSRLSREQLLSFRGDKYLAGNTIVVFAGRVDHAACVRRVSKLITALPASRLPRWTSVTDRVGQGRTAFQVRDIEQTHLAVGIRLFGRRDTRRHALRLLSGILGENMSSRLFQIVRERHALAYSIHSGCHLHNETGTMVITSGLDARNLPKALRLIVRELCRLRDRPVSPAELNRVKEYAVGQIRLAFESTSNHMMWLGENLLSFGRYIPPEETIAAIMQVTAKDLQNVADEVLRYDRVSMAVVSPELSAGLRDAAAGELNRL